MLIVQKKLWIKDGKRKGGVSIFSKWQLENYVWRQWYLIINLDWDKNKVIKPKAVLELAHKSSIYAFSWDRPQFLKINYIYKYLINIVKIYNWIGLGMSLKSIVALQQLVKYKYTSFKTLWPAITMTSSKDRWIGVC